MKMARLNCQPFNTSVARHAHFTGKQYIIETSSIELLTYRDKFYSFISSCNYKCTVYHENF